MFEHFISDKIFAHSLLLIFKLHWRTNGERTKCFFETSATFEAITVLVVVSNEHTSEALY